MSGHDLNGIRIRIKDGVPAAIGKQGVAPNQESCQRTGFRSRGAVGLIFPGKPPHGLEVGLTLCGSIRGRKQNRKALGQDFIIAEVTVKSGIMAKCSSSFSS